MPMFFVFPFLLILTSVFMTACSSTSSKGGDPLTSPTFTYTKIPVVDYEDDHIKVAKHTDVSYRINETTKKSETFQKETGHMVIHLKKKGKFIVVEKRPKSNQPGETGKYDYGINVPGRLYFKSNSYYTQGGCGAYMAYVPTRGLVCWDQGDQYGGMGRLVFDENRENNYPHMAASVQIYRSKIDPSGVFAEKTLLVTVRNNPLAKADQTLGQFVADAELYVKGKFEKVMSWKDLHDFRQSRLEFSEIGAPPLFLRHSPNSVQISFKQPNGLLKVVTLNKDFAEKAVHNDILVATLRPDHPTQEHFAPTSYRHRSDQVDYTVFSKNEKVDRSRFQFSLLKAHPTQKNWFVLITPDGEEALPQDSIGVIPVLVKENHRWGYLPQNVRTYLGVHGWVVAYAKPDKKIGWGWASPELTWVSGPIWQDLYFQEAEFKHYQYVGWNNDVYHQYGGREPGVAASFLSGPLLVVQLMDGKWQAYTQQAYLFDSAQKNSATYNRPNNFGGAWGSASTGAEAVKLAQAGIANYQRQIAQRTKQRYLTLVQHNDALWKQRKEQEVKKMIADHEAEQTAQWKRRMEAERIQALEGSEARAITLQNARSSSFTNRLRNMSGAGSSSRATSSLESMTNQLRQAHGKGYNSK